MYRTISVAALSLIVATAACSGSKKAETEESTETVEQTATAEASAQSKTEEKPPPDQGEGIAWEDKSFDQKRAYMKETVKPHMAELMEGFDSEVFGEVKCSTCHGSDAKERDFVMPSPDLPKLDDWERLEREQPEMMEFMKTKMVPEMAALLDMKPYDPETKTGFGCGGCHPR